MSSSHARRLPFLALTFAALCLLCGGSPGALAQRAAEVQTPATGTAPKPGGGPITDEEVKDAIRRLLNEAVELHLHDRFDEALERERRVLAFYERLYEPNHTTVAQLLDIIGLTAQKKGDLASAEQMFERALAIYRASPEEHSGDIAGVLLGLGGVWTDRGISRALSRRSARRWRRLRSCSERSPPNILTRC